MKLERDIISIKGQNKKETLYLCVPKDLALFLDWSKGTTIQFRRDKDKVYIQEVK